MQEDTGELRALAKDEVDIEVKRGNEDLIFHVGERVKVKGGDFRVYSLGKKMMVLEGLPGTRIEMGTGKWESER